MSIKFRGHNKKCTVKCFFFMLLIVIKLSKSGNPTMPCKMQMNSSVWSRDSQKNSGQEAAKGPSIEFDDQEWHC